MGKIAFVFSGQGDQFPGMGKDLFEAYGEAKEVFELCESLRPGTIEQCFNGTKEELKETKNTQACLFAMELAAANTLKSKGICPDLAAGFSLGEVSAAAFSGVFDLTEGFKLVCRRGELMQTEADRFDTSMAAVLKLDEETLRGICEKYTDIYPVNFNCPGQITVSGLSSQMKDFYGDVKAAGGRAIPVNVKGAFHSPFMKGAAEGFKKELDKAAAASPNIVLYSNMTADVYTDNVSELLSKQIESPVLWEKIIRKMIEAGADTFIEIGPGKTLTNMIRKIDPEVKAFNYAEALSEETPC